MEQPTHSFKTGTRFVESTTSWQPHIQAHLRLDGLFIYDFWQNPCYHEILKARKYPAELALAEAEDLRFLLFRFGQLPWADIPLGVVALPPVQLVEEVLPVYMVAIGADDGIIRVSLTGSIKGEFFDRLKQFITKQRQVRMEDDELTDRVTALFTNYPTPAHFLPCALARTFIHQNKNDGGSGFSVDLDIETAVA